MDVFDVEKGRYFGLRKIIRNIVFVTLICVCVLASFTACGNNGGDAVKLSFKSASGYDYLKTLDGKQVTINGYIATSSPVDGSFIFLMNLPYQSCPFCVPNTSELSNTIEVYPAKGENFASFTAQAIKVVGTLVVAENKDGSMCAHVPVAWIRINPSMNLTDEQRNTLSERMKNTRRNMLDKG